MDSGVSAQTNSIIHAWADPLGRAQSSSGKRHGRILAPVVVSFCCCNGAKKLSGPLDQPEGQKLLQANERLVVRNIRLICLIPNP